MCFPPVRQTMDANFPYCASDGFVVILYQIVDMAASHKKKGVDILGTFAAYNRCYSGGKREAFMEYFMCTALRKDSSTASNCIQCGKCEGHCPQHIQIRQELKNARKTA